MMATSLSSDLSTRTRRQLGPNRGAESGQMQNLLGEFKGLYEGRLKKLEEAEQEGDDTLRVMVFMTSVSHLMASVLNYPCSPTRDCYQSLQ